MPTCAICRTDKTRSEFTKNQAHKAKASKGGVCITCQNIESLSCHTASQCSFSPRAENQNNTTPSSIRVNPVLGILSGLRQRACPSRADHRYVLRGSSSSNSCIDEVEFVIAQANSMFKNGKFKDAVACYMQVSHLLRPLAQEARADSKEGSRMSDTLRSQVIELHATLHANASQCYLNLNQFKLAQDEASKCLKHMPMHEKALLRHASASEQLGEWKNAIADLEMLMVMNPAEAANHRNKLEKLRKRCAQDGQDSKCSLVAGGMHQGRPHPAGWAIGLQKEKKYEWFVDCYRMRVDDDYCWGGENLHGLYNIDGVSAGSVVVDFLLFCKLAVARGAIPTPWSWSGCLDVAARLLEYAFEKSDAQEKWGTENFFSTGIGGRSLRCTAELIYGESCQLGMFTDGPEDDLRSAIEVEIESKLGYSPGPENIQGKVLKNVGGDMIWRNLCEKLVPSLGLGEELDDYFEDGEDEEEEEEDMHGDVESDDESFEFGGHKGDAKWATEEGVQRGAACVTTPGINAAQHACAHCGRKVGSLESFQKCSRCKAVRYCSQECQKENWTTHKKICRAPQVVA